MSGLDHAVCRLDRKPCGAPDCDAAIDALNQVHRDLVAMKSEPMSVVVQNADGSFGFTTVRAELPTGDIFRARAKAPRTMNRRMRRAEAARARHG